MEDRHESFPEYVLKGRGRKVGHEPSSPCGGAVSIGKTFPASYSVGELRYQAEGALYIHTPHAGLRSGTVLRRAKYGLQGVHTKTLFSMGEKIKERKRKEKKGKKRKRSSRLSRIISVRTNGKMSR